MSKNSFSVDNEGSSEGNSGIWSSGDEGSVDTGDGLCDVSDERNLEISKSTSFGWLLAVLEVGELGVDGSSNELASHLSELRSSLSKGDNLGWADKGEVKRVEEKYEVLSSKVRRLYCLEIKLLVSLSLKVWGLLTDLSSWVDVLRVDPVRETGVSSVLLRQDEVFVHFIYNLTDHVVL